MKFRINGFIILPALVLIVFDFSATLILLLLAILLHESGHLLAARLLSVRITELRLDFFGARLMLEGGVVSYGRELLLSAAGPAVNLLSGAAALPFCDRHIHIALFAAASFMLGGLNLLPVATFDGGRILFCWLSMFLSPSATEKTLNFCSMMCIILIWCVSVYLLMRVGSSVAVYIFAISLFSGIAVKDGYI